MPSHTACPHRPASQSAKKKLGKPQAWHSQHILVAVSLWRVSAACTVCRSSRFLLI
jgi:hypothetical protein